MVIHHAELLGRDLCHHCIADSVFYQYGDIRISISLLGYLFRLKECIGINCALKFSRKPGSNGYFAGAQQHLLVTTSKFWFDIATS